MEMSVKCPHCGTIFYEKTERCPDCDGSIGYPREQAGPSANEGGDTGRRESRRAASPRPSFSALPRRLSRFVGDAREALTGELLSLDRASVRSLLRSHLFWPIFLFAAFPLVLEFFRIEQIPGMTIYFSLIWLVLFYRLFGFDGRPFRLYLYFYFFSMVVGFLVFRILYTATQGLYPLTEAEGMTERLVGFVVGVGLTEELAKIAPVALFLFLAHCHSLFRLGQDYLLYGIVAGLSFAALENIGYITGSAVAEQVGGVETLGLSASVTMSRVIMTPFIHACLSGILGHFLSRGHDAGPGRPSGIAYFLVGLVLVSILHGGYNFLADSASGAPMATAALGFLYFLLLICVLRARTVSDGAGATRALFKHRLF